MNLKFSEKINNFLKIIAKNAQIQNKRVFFVGGIVRDFFLNVDTLDIDLLFEGNAIEFSKTLSSEIQIKSIHQDFSTVKVSYQDIEIDIASSRTEKYPYSGCLPVLDEIGVLINQDVSRRDFSVNSIYAEITLNNDELEFKIIDLVGGINDIKNKTLRVLHNKSYIDDPTRIIRGLGFKYRFGFEFSMCDKKLIKEYLDKIDYSKMSHDRNLKVFKKVLSCAFQDDIFSEIIKNKYYKIINPDDIQVDFSFMDKINSLFKFSIERKVKFYVLILQNFNIQKMELKDILKIYKTFKKIKEEDLAYYFYKTNDKNVLKYFEIKDISIFTNGDDLIKLGIKQGVEIGRVLDKLLEYKLLNIGKINSKDDEIKLINSGFHEI